MFFLLQGCFVFTAFQSCDPNELFVWFEYQAVIPKRFEDGLSAKNDGRSKFWVVPVVYQDPFCCEQNAFVFTRNLRCGVDTVVAGPMFIWSRRYNTSKARSIFCWYLFARLRFFLIYSLRWGSKGKRTNGWCLRCNYEDQSLFGWGQWNENKHIVGWFFYLFLFTS